MRYIPLIFCALLGLLLACGCAGSGKSDPLPYGVAGELPAELRGAQEFVDEGRAKKALRPLARWIKANPMHRAMDEVLFLQSHAQLNINRDYKAGETYKILIKNHSASRHYTQALEGQVLIAERFLNGQKRPVLGFIWVTAKGDAVEMLDQVVLSWPGSPLAGRALMMQADFFYREKRFVEAQTTYQIIVDNYRSSPQFRQALLQNAHATFAQFNGPNYDSTPLSESKIRYMQSRDTLPDTISASEIDQRLGEIEILLAEKELNIADYYHRIGYVGEAELYRNYVITRWPDNERARQPFESAE
jgi:outer membrane protein assembly factor BamD (BamD/ComL family)